MGCVDPNMKPWPDGSWVCIDGFYHVCMGNAWRKTKFPCDDGDSHGSGGESHGYEGIPWAEDEDGGDK